MDDDDPRRCPVCGYTAEDERLYGDHHLCKGTIPMSVTASFDEPHTGETTMAWNPAPEVAACRDFGKKFGANRVIIVYTLPDGRIGMASYGKTKELCAQTAPLGDAAFFAVRKAYEQQCDIFS